MCSDPREAASGSIIAQAAALADLIQVQDGAIVSRTLIDKKQGTVTLFAFDRGQRLSEHTAPFDALVYAIEGDLEVTISGKAGTVKAGEIIILPADEPHAVAATSRCKMLLVMIRS